MSRDGIVIGRRRGVLDLHDFVHSGDVLRGAAVADKVVGKGAAALLVVGGATAVYAQLISEPAYRLLTKNGVGVRYALKVPNIMNRDRSGYCPLETACRDAASAEDCMPIVDDFVNQMLNKQKP